MRAKMKKLISKYPVTSFFVMAIVFSWIAVTPKILNPALSPELFMILGALAGPTLSAIIVTAVTDGKAGLGAFFRRWVQFRAGIVWWLIVLFGILAGLNITAALILGSSVLTKFMQEIGLILPAYLVTLVAGVILGPLFEEPGWRGFALPRMQEKYGPIAASVILGVIWAGWHAPGYLGGWMQSSFAALLVYCVGFSILATWIYNNTRGSILLMILLHSSSNAAISVGIQVLPVDLSPAMHALVYGGWVPAIMGAAAAILILVFTRWNLGYKSGRQANAQVAVQNV
jgi:membrane protease YdiL (CAAX protease family)